MHPRLWTTPYFTLHTFGVLLAVAFLVALWWVVRAARRDGLRPDLLMSLGIWAIVGGILGAKLLLVLRTLPEYLAQPSELLSLAFVETAGDFYGGFLGALAACAIYFWVHPELPAWRAADLCAPAIALGTRCSTLSLGSCSNTFGATQIEDSSSAVLSRRRNSSHSCFLSHPLLCWSSGT
jgi:phosphatidylglycerol---prolipoprotein diacylglyceryl transferase